MFTLTANNDVVEIRFRTDDFQDTIEVLKANGCTFNPTKKCWEKSITFFDQLALDLGVYDTVEVDELSKKIYSNYKKSIKELQVVESRRKFKPELLQHPPLVGKHPFEDYQKIDISQAIMQNRYLFNWTMGLGKSYAMAALIEHLKYYDNVDHFLVFSTSSGVYNLKSELLKFLTTYNSDDIYMYKTSDTDKDIFVPQNKIIIMTYDSFKSVNNYYYEQNYIYNKSSKKALKLLNELQEAYDNAVDKKEKSKAKKELEAQLKKMKPSIKVAYRNSFIDYKKWCDKDICMFLDESHSVSHSNTRRSEIIKININNFKYRYLFTGTFADKFENMYQQIAILDKALVDGMNYTDWCAAYNDVGNRYSRFGINDDKWNIEKLSELNHKLTTLYGSKREAIDCLDLPLNYQVPTIYVDMSKEQRDIYQLFTKENIEIIKRNEGSINVVNVINMFPYFQLAVDNPETIKLEKISQLSQELQDKVKKFDYIKNNTKVDIFKDIVSERTDEEKERGILWYYHPKTKDALIKIFEKYNPIIIEAGLDKEELFARITEFKNNESHKLIIGSINVMNTSVTLTECKYQIYCEMTYKYQDYEQSTGRIHRNGQTDVTRTYTVRFNDSVDNVQKANLDTKGQVCSILLNRKFISQDIWKMIFNANNNFNIGGI